MKHSKKKSSSLLPAMLSAGVCAVSLGGIVTSIPSVAYANSVDTQSTPSLSSNDTDRGARSQVQSNHAVNTASKSEKAAISKNTARTTSTDPTPAPTDDNSVTWTREDFNITPDGKQIGYRKDITVSAHDGKPASTENVIVPGLNAKGLAKLKKNPHLVIPEGIEVVHECAFTGRANKVGNHHEHVDGETYIESLTLPQSLKIIEYGAFGWNKIKGTVVIPKSVVSIHASAFISNQIEKVVFEGVIDGKGKLKESDSEPYYVAGIGSKAFQGNRITDIVVPGNFADMKLHFDNTKPNDPDPGPFDNQEYDTTTIEVGEAFTSPLTIHQAGNKQEKISSMGGFMENRIPTLIAYSSYFDLKNGAYVAKKTGTIQGQWILYDVRNGINSPIGTLHFSYEILSKGSLCTVTFNNEHTVIAKVRVKKGQTITKGAVNNGQMPPDPKKASFTFMGWNAAADGSGAAFSAGTTVTQDLDVYAYFKNFEPTLDVKGASITEGESLDLKSLVVSATDKEDGDLKDKVVIADQGGYSNAKPGSYKIVFQVTDNGKARVSKTATVTVNKKPIPWVTLNAAPSLIVQDKAITEGDPLDLRSLIVSATDPEDGDLKDKVVIADQGGYSNAKPGSYKIVFQVTDNGKARVSKTATVTVNKKPIPWVTLNAAPSLIVQDKTITEGDPLDLRSLVVSATDPEDGDLKDKVVIADQGGFTNTKPGSYKIVFQVTDKGKACVSKTATVTVNKKPTPVPVPPTPQTNSQPEPQHMGKHTPQHFLPKTGDLSSLGMLAALLGVSCAIFGTLGKNLVQKRK